MEVISERSSPSTLNPNAPMFIPFVYRTVEDFSDQWWALIQSSPWFRDYWLQERFFDPQNEPFFSDFDDLLLPDVDELFYDEIQQEEKEERDFCRYLVSLEELKKEIDYLISLEEDKKERDFCRDLVSLKMLKWKQGRDLFEKSRHTEKVAKIVNVKVSPRTIQQPR